MSSAPGTESADALAWAEKAHALVQAHPRQALELAERALAASVSQRDVKAEIAARYALGFAQHTLGDAQASRRTLRTGIRLAERHGDAHGAGLLRRHLAFQLAADGRTHAARRELAEATAVLSGIERARSQVHRLAIHRQSQTTDLALHSQTLADAAAALRLLRKTGDTIWEARLLKNRGVLHFERGELDRAEADFSLARACYIRAGADTAAAGVLAALADVDLLRGELIACLQRLADAEEELTPGHLSYDLVECRMLALSRARLLPEARAAADVWLELCVRTGRRDFAANAMLDVAALAVASGDTQEGERLAERAARSFAARGKQVNAALARTVVLRTRLATGVIAASAPRSAAQAATVLERAGWRNDALRTRLLVARIAITVGSTSLARKQLDLARPLWTRGTVTDRIELCHVRALLRVARSDATGAERQLKQGLQLLDDYRAALGAVELRATASGIGSELSRLGLRIAIESGDPNKVLGWAERLRANALRLPPVRPSGDKKLRDLQTDLRRAVAAARTTEQTQLEASIRSRARLVDAAEGMQTSAPDIDATAQLLGGRALVEYAELDGALYALTLVEGQLGLHELGTAKAGAELGWLRFAFGRIAAGRMTSEQRAATSGNAGASAAALDKLLVEEIRSVIGDRPLVVVPTGALHAIPWNALPSLRGRPVVVAPSLATWSALAARSRSRRRKIVLVAGPRLRHSAAEVRELSALFDGGTVLTGKSATAAAALKALDGAALAHVACHGHFRSDSPLFSSLELADGPLNVYELQTLRRAPDMVVLSACDLATSDLHPGDEVLGLAAALLAMGTRTIVASVVPAPDAAVKRLMLAFHRNLLAGDTPAAALARAQSRAAVAGFVCLGSG